MPQDQGPTQEPPRVSKADLAVQVYNLGDLTEKTEGLPEGAKINIDSVGFNLEFLIKKWKGKENSWGELKGKKVLDLGSGSALGDPEWQPYFARLCANNGASVTAVDIRHQAESDAKLFKAIIADMIPYVMQGNLRDLVGEEKYDVIHSSEFVGVNPAAELQLMAYESNFPLDDFEKKLFNQCIDLLAEGGIIFLDQSGGFYYTKKEGKLLRL